jgi:hypothetical protein
MRYGRPSLETLERRLPPAALSAVGDETPAAATPTLNLTSILLLQALTQPFTTGQKDATQLGAEVKADFQKFDADKAALAPQSVLFQDLAEGYGDLGQIEGILSQMQAQQATVNTLLLLSFLGGGFGGNENLFVLLTASQQIGTSLSSAQAVLSDAQAAAHTT